MKRWELVTIMKRIHYITLLAFVFGGFNFLLGMGIIEVGIMGGTATNGKIEQGEYYLGEHGTYTPVSHATFKICKNYEKFVIFLFVFSFIASGLTYLLQKRPRETLSTITMKE